MLGCYVDYGRDSEQHAWLQRDLARVDRSRTPWVIIGMHAPWCGAGAAAPFSCMAPYTVCMHACNHCTRACGVPTHSGSSTLMWARLGCGWLVRNPEHALLQ